MTANFKTPMTFFFMTLLLFSFSSNAFSQGLLDKLKKKGEEAINKSVDDILNGKKKTNKQSTENKKEENNISVTSNRRPVLSELKDEDFIQNSSTPLRDTANTRYRIARNLWIDIKGKYPNGYSPKWRFITYQSPLKLTTEDWVNPRSQTGVDEKNIWIGDYKGKAVIRFKAHFDCECFAEIITKDSISVLTENPQTYELGNFTRILNDRATGEPCNGGLYPQKNGGKAGKITLSANENGDLVMSMMMEYYTAPEKNVRVYNEQTRKYEFKEYVPSQVHYRYSANNITVDNEMSAEKATEIVRVEQEAKQKQKQYIANCKKQVDDLMKKIKQKYPQPECRECYVRERGMGLKTTPTKTLYTDGFGNEYIESGTDWDISSKLHIKNKCNYKLTFIGIQQLYDEERGYYFKDVACTMDANYEYYVEQGMFSALFTSLIGNNSDIYLQKEYDINSATVNSIQWIKVIRKQ